jgi:hypothetical protein
MVLLLALLLRAGWAAAVGSHPVSDAEAYQRLAGQLAGGGCYGFDGRPYTYWPVGYPFFLSLQMRLFGPDTQLLVAAEVLLGVGLVALTMLLCKQWSAPPRAALPAGLIVAVYLPYVEYSSITSSETLFAVLILGAFCCWGGRKQVTCARAVGAGLFLGRASYVRPVALPLALALVAAYWFRWHRTWYVGVRAVVMLAACLLVLAPWTYRNYRVYHRFIPVSTNGGMCLYFGNNPDAPDACQSISYPDFNGDDAERDLFCRARAIAYIEADPIGFVKRSVLKFGTLWDRDTIGVVWNAPGIESAFGARGAFVLKVVNQVFWVAFLGLLGAASLFLLRREGIIALLGNPGVWACFILTVLYSVTSSQDRYHHPFIALLAPLAGCYLALRGRRPCVRS